MRPKDLKSPHRWHDRQVSIYDRVWFVPSFYDNYQSFQFPGWQSPELFGNDNPIKVEYCSGNGLWIVEKAQQFPQYNWVAVEIKFERVRKIWSKLKNLNINNLIVICGEALTTTTHYFPSDCVDEVFINFPDPWPKRRHAKHRLIAPPFVDQVWRSMRKGGTITFVTDDPETGDRAIEELGGNPGFQSRHPEPYFVNRLPGYGSSYFEMLWRSKGKEIRYHQFEAKERS
jgi:tRNA (guanine-N7-)-methyltransferase